MLSHRRFLALLAALTPIVWTAAQPAAARSTAASPPVAGASGALPGVGSYPRVIHLEHGGPADGTIIETDTSASVAHTQRFHRSTDGGKTFEPLPSLALPGNIHGTDLFEMPADAGALPAGTLLFAAAVNPSGQYPAESGATQMQIPVYRSNDGAASWSLLSYCARTDDGGITGGLWEPELHVADDGRLVCLYSDETDHPAHSQVLTQVLSDDGGATWTAPQQVVATPDPIDRPGMPTTARLGDGSWVMTYEDCGLRHAPCLVLIRTGPDGIHWGPPTSDGTVVTATDGARFTSSPTVAWSPGGGPAGTVLVIGRIFNRANGLADPGNGATVLASYHGAAGPWHEIAAPVAVAARYDDEPINYSSPLLPLGHDLLLGFAADHAAAGPVVRWAITAVPAEPLAPPSSTTTTSAVPAGSPGTASASPATPVAAQPAFTG